MFTIGFVLAAICLAIYVSYRRQFAYWTRHRSVPSIPGKIFNGDLRSFLTFETNLGYHLKTIYDDPKFADKPVVGVYGLYKPSLLIREPELVKSVLVKDFESFRNRFDDIDIDHDPIAAQAMFFAKYGIWKEMRTKLSPIFSNAKLKNMYGLIQSVAVNMESFLAKQPNVYAVEMKDFCARYTTDVIATTLLGFQSNSLHNPSEELNNDIRLLTDFNWRRAFNFVIVLFAPKMARLCNAKLLYPQTERFLRDSITQAMKDRECSGEHRNDLIDFLVKLKEEAAKSGRNMPQFMDCLIAQAGIFTTGGFDTSSTTMSNALLELAKTPEAQQKLKSEISSAFAKEKESTISYDDINRMEYLGMVISETLRLYPVFSVLDRKYNRPAGKTEPYSLKPYCDYTLPDGMPVFISTYGLHYDPKVRDIVLNYFYNLLYPALMSIITIW